MNPTLPIDYLARMEQDDPEAYRSEVLGEFRAGISALFEPDALDACIEEGVRERGPERRVTYFAFVDAASGAGKDAFAVGIAHRDGQRGVLDVVRAWRPPFNPSGVIAECADLLKTYGCREAQGDRYAPGFVAEHFRTHGVTYVYSERDRSAVYLELLPRVNSRAVVLLDAPDLLRELRGLERRRGQSGRDRVDHRAGAHDDRANASAGALVAAVVADDAPRFEMFTDSLSVAPRPFDWTAEELAEVGVYAVNGVWTHSLGDEHAARIVSGVITREEALRAIERRRVDEEAMEAGRREER